MPPRMDVVGVPIVTPTQVFDMLDGGLASGDGGPLADSSLLAVDLDVGHTHAYGLADLTRRAPCVVIGIGSLPRTLAAPPDLDVLLTDVPAAPRPWRSCAEGIERALSTLSLSVLCAPRAATTLAQVLRMGRDLSFDEALVAESLAYSMLQAGSEFASWSEGRDRKPHRLAEAVPVETDRSDATLTVTLQRPRARNAIDTATRDGLAAAFDRASLDSSVERINLRGAGPVFCTGQDLDELSRTPDAVTAHLGRTSRSPARALRRCADRTTAHVHGRCAGPGLELAALAGRVVAAADARFELPEIRMGLMPGTGGTVTLPRRIGRQRTAWMALTGAPVDVETALDWGLVDVA